MTALGLGTAPLGNLFTAVSDEQASATVFAAWDAGVRYFDTAPQYGHGLAEVRLGRSLAGFPRDEFVLASKVGRLLRRTEGERPASAFVDIPDADPVFDFTRDGVLRSLDESLQRLGVDHLDVVHVHDPDEFEDLAAAEAFPALLSLRDQGVIGRVGCGMNQFEMLSRFVDRFDLDCVLLAGRWSLLDRSGAPLLEQCAARGVGVVLGGVFNSGLLANPSPDATFDYAVAAPERVAAAQRLQRVCADAGVPLPAAAVQFAMRHPAVRTVLVGARSPEEMAADAAWAGAPLPDDLWSALDVALRER